MGSGVLSSPERNYGETSGLHTAPRVATGRPEVIPLIPPHALSAERAWRQSDRLSRDSRRPGASAAPAPGMAEADLVDNPFRAWYARMSVYRSLTRSTNPERMQYRAALGR